jgi:hypothetical protein
MVSGLLKQGNHLVTRVKSNAVAYCSRSEEERPQDKGATQDLWKEDKAEVFVCECQINATGCQSGLW